VCLRSSAGSSGAVRIQPTIAGEGHNGLRWNIRILNY
jgi:hypothetical protein